MAHVAIGLGSNLGDRLNHMVRAIRALAPYDAIWNVNISPIYETEAMDCPEPIPFLNAAITLETSMDPELLLGLCQGIETALDRTRPYPNAPRTLDMDLLLYDTQVQESTQLTLPHPRMHERLFVIEPLHQIAGDWVHPVLKATIKQIRQDLLDGGATGVMEMGQLSWPDDLIG